MKALTWHGKHDMRCESVPDPQIEHPRDAIIKVTACAICGSDLHIYDGIIPSMKHGDVLGHETMGEVVEVGSGNTKLKKGDRVVVPFTIACGECFFCQARLLLRLRTVQPQCRNGGGSFGAIPLPASSATRTCSADSRRTGGVSPRPLCRCRPDQGAGRSERRAGAVPVRHFPHRLHGRRVLRHQRRRDDRGVRLRSGGAIRHPQRLPAGRRARYRHRHRAGAPCARARGRRAYHRFQAGRRLRAHPGADRMAAVPMLVSTPSAPRRTPPPASIPSSIAPRPLSISGTDRPHVLRQAIHCTRNFGVVSIVGVYGGFLDKIPMGSAINPRSDVPHGPDACAALPAEAAGADRGRQDRPVLRHHPHALASSRGRRCTRRSATSRTAASRW